MKNQAANNGTFIPKPGFTVVQNSVARDWNLSSGALGLFTRIQSYITMENITLTKGSLMERVPDGEYAFNTAWNELKSKGYLFIHVYPGEKGRFVYQYELRLDNSGWDGAYLFYHDRNGNVKSTNLTRNKTETAEQPAEKAAADHHPNYHPGGNHHSGNHCGGNRGGNIKLRQHRIIPALRLKHRSGSCGTASALPKCSIMSGCGTRIVLRGKSPSHSATAAPASVRCIRHWRRSPLQHKVLSALLA